MVLRTRAPGKGKHLLSDLKLKSLVKNMIAGDHPDGHRLDLCIDPWFMASILTTGMTRAAPVPRAGQMAPNR